MTAVLAPRPRTDAPMLVPTRLFGPLTVHPDSCILFPEGLLGFAGERRFILLPAAPEGVFWMQAVDDAGLAFLTVNPLLFEPDYAPDLGGAMPPETSEVGLLAIVTLPRRAGDPCTMNLQGPVVIDFSARTGRQVIVTRGSYSTRHRIDGRQLLRGAA